MTDPITSRITLIDFEMSARVSEKAIAKHLWRRPPLADWVRRTGGGNLLAYNFDPFAEDIRAMGLMLRNDIPNLVSCLSNDTVVVGVTLYA